MAKQPSPVGESVSESIERKLRTSAEYRAIHEELEPFERLARIVIMRRAQLGLTQEELAKRMGTTASAVSRIEHGQHKTRPETLRKLAKALGGQAVVGFVFADSPDTHELVAL